MLEIFIFLLIGISVYTSILINKNRTKKKRAKLKHQLFPPKWRSLLESKIFLYKRLPSHLKLELHKHIQVFLAEKKIIGRENLLVTEEMQVIIASQACILLLGDKLKNRNYFPYLKYIHVYPHHIEFTNHKYQKANLLLGQSSVGNKSGQDGVVSLCWSQVYRESLSPNQGENVILHEFAHQLDQEFGSATGTPRLPTLQDSLAWGEVFTSEYQQHYQQVMNNEATIIDRYGATNLVEFFAVATETFFMKSRLLAVYHPLLYQQLQKYYGVDPVNWN